MGTMSCEETKDDEMAGKAAPLSTMAETADELGETVENEMRRLTVGIRARVGSIVGSSLAVGDKSRRRILSVGVAEVGRTVDGGGKVGYPEKYPERISRPRTEDPAMVLTASGST